MMESLLYWVILHIKALKKKKKCLIRRTIHFLIFVNEQDSFVILI